MRNSLKAEANKMKLTRTKDDEQTRKTIVTQKDKSDKIVLR